MVVQDLGCDARFVFQTVPVAAGCAFGAIVLLTVVVYGYYRCKRRLINDVSSWAPMMSLSQDFHWESCPDILTLQDRPVLKDDSGFLEDFKPDASCDTLSFVSTAMKRDASSYYFLTLDSEHMIHDNS
ncbi:unnamed protein product [Soboliphyme baturini]|uniref:Ephrin RBD domain-containing protein n=1 Tax=Soboliphyme baturini TaxID=241478 RepID=A0A183J9L2_9BILA|nr:unnamed protein product [Soboliphyme baturini]